MSTFFDKMRPKEGSFRGFLRSSVFGWLAVAAIAVAVGRIAISYSALCQTSDEGGHIATGMQFIDHGKFTYETLHPTLGRAATAILPYLDGARSHGDTIFWNEGNDILFGQGTYWRTLTLARLGILPFFLLSAFLLWSWAKKMYGPEIAFFSVFFFSLVPPVLAHAGLATTDTPFAAAFLASCYALWWFLDSPEHLRLRWRIIILGIVIGLSAGTKYSFLFFFPPAAALIMIYKLRVVRRISDAPEPEAVIEPVAVIEPNTAEKQNAPSLFLKGAGVTLLVLLTACLTLWASFGFSYGPVPITNGTLAVKYEAGGSYPAPEYISGINLVMTKNDKGNATYFMGKPMYNHGSPWFFPVALGVKTPIAMLLLILLGAAIIVSKFINSRYKGDLSASEKRWRALALLPILISALMLLMVMPSNINIGIRHILAIYPFLAMLAAIGAVWLLSHWKIYGRIALAVLLVWMVDSSMSSDPDRLAYFNEFASKTSAHPVLLDSDLDWGQDASKLADTLRARGIKWADIEYFAPANLVKMGIPNFERLNWFTLPNSEWVAISKLALYCYDGYAWLRPAVPVAVVGNSILLFHETPTQYSKLFAPFVANAEASAFASPSPSNFLDLSVVEYKAGNFAKCVIAAQKALVLKPDYADAYNNIAAGYLKLNQWDSSIAAANEALRLNPSLRIPKNIIDSALNEKKQDEAEGALLAAKILTTNSTDTLLDISRRASYAGHYDVCVAAAQKALSLKPDFAEAYNNICAAYNKLGRFDDARKAGEQAVRLQPDNPLAISNLKQALDGLNKK